MGKVIGRILFLEGIPVVSELRKMLIGPDVPKIFGSDGNLESDAIKTYKSAIQVCVNAQDFATREV
jgi:bacterioferritin